MSTLTYITNMQQTGKGLCPFYGKELSVDENGPFLLLNVDLDGSDPGGTLFVTPSQSVFDSYIHHFGPHIPNDGEKPYTLLPVVIEGTGTKLSPAYATTFADKTLADIAKRPLDKLVLATRS